MERIVQWFFECLRPKLVLTSDEQAQIYIVIVGHESHDLQVIRSTRYQMQWAKPKQTAKIRCTMRLILVGEAETHDLSTGARAEALGHLRLLPAIAMNASEREGTRDVEAAVQVYDSVANPSALMSQIPADLTLLRTCTLLRISIQLHSHGL